MCTTIAGFSRWVLGTEFRSSCLCCKNFTTLAFPHPFCKLLMKDHGSSEICPPWCWQERLIQYLILGECFPGPHNAKCPVWFLDIFSPYFVQKKNLLLGDNHWGKNQSLRGRFFIKLMLRLFVRASFVCRRYTLFWCWLFFLRHVHWMTLRSKVLRHISPLNPSTFCNLSRSVLIERRAVCSHC